MTLTELQMKEVVVMEGGRRLGQIVDLEIDDDSGVINDIIILDRQGKGAFFQKPEEIKIKWRQIVTIGADIILINEELEEKSVIEEEK